MSAIDNISQSVWNKINGTPATGGQAATDGLLETVTKQIRIARTVFPWIFQGSDNPIPADIVDPVSRIPSAGQTKPVVTISIQFQLANLHIQDPTAAMLYSQATPGAQSLAVVEESLFVQGDKAAVPPGVLVSNQSALNGGLLEQATLGGRAPIKVSPRKDLFQRYTPFKDHHTLPAAAITQDGRLMVGPARTKCFKSPVTVRSAFTEVATCRWTAVRPVPQAVIRAFGQRPLMLRTAIRRYGDALAKPSSLSGEKDKRTKRINNNEIFKILPPAVCGAGTVVPRS
jgi:hypothetical protein